MRMERLAAATVSGGSSGIGMSLSGEMGSDTDGEAFMRLGGFSSGIGQSLNR